MTRLLALALTTVVLACGPSPEEMERNAEEAAATREQCLAGYVNLIEGRDALKASKSLLETSLRELSAGIAESERSFRRMPPNPRSEQGRAEMAEHEESLEKRTEIVDLIAEMEHEIRVLEAEIRFTEC